MEVDWGKSGWIEVINMIYDMIWHMPWHMTYHHISQGTRFESRLGWDLKYVSECRSVSSMSLTLVRKCCRLPMPTMPRRLHCHAAVSNSLSPILFDLPVWNVWPWHKHIWVWLSLWTLPGNQDIRSAQAL